MQAVRLRPERCLYCGGAMSSVGRIDRRSCNESCRTLTYRHRKRTGEPAKRRERIPKWAEGHPLVIGSALATLAARQGRVAAILKARRSPCPSLRDGDGVSKVMDEPQRDVMPRYPAVMSEHDMNREEARVCQRQR